MLCLGYKFHQKHQTPTSIGIIRTCEGCSQNVGVCHKTEIEIQWWVPTFTRQENNTKRRFMDNLNIFYWKKLTIKAILVESGCMLQTNTNWEYQTKDLPCRPDELEGPLHCQSCPAFVWLRLSFYLQSTDWLNVTVNAFSIFDFKGSHFKCFN